MAFDDERLAILQAAELETQAIRMGHHRTPEGEHSEPIFTTSSYVFDSAEAAAARFNGDQPGNVYSRYTNPTVRIFEERMAALEGADDAVATSSGMAAIMSTCMALLKQGDHVVCSSSVFGTTTVVFNKYLAKFGVDVTFVEPTDYEKWQSAVGENTRLLFLETPSNPLSEIVDIRRVADIAHAKDAYLVVDNCFCTPALQQPLSLGADVVVHSATKFLDGQGRCLGGVVVGSQDICNEVLGFIRSAGPTMSPFNAWVFIKGLETLKLRMDAHSRQALALAQWLQNQPGIEKVFYSGLPEHPQHALAARQQSGFGGVLALQVKGDKAAAWRFIDATRLLSITANLGDVKTTIVHPATTTHGRLSDDQKARCGITDNLIRIAVGLENIEDIKQDLERGLAAV
ncbi:O-succinylhomoserine sulfhydrylase [BD1-7 clade bacterium]|uniref:O-succinylhomoserine sulfhydrylase n=1 Tax=BD1-7 clade bacterium TaxID=2029982 RepID=A0A5S9NT58_9GAMM|nr:O-succinylhomoserine sulfhydrylase [BD1-7 clade bacterium]CAA0093858.1 O-succinylhomoserine sulfhydrylase [BD1-7 clade bacterium]